MSDKQRAEFERWAEGSYVLDKSRYGEYMAVKTNIAWQAWQAAIASVVVELPEMHDGSNPCRCYYDKDEVEQALTEAGIRYE